MVPIQDISVSVKEKSISRDTYIRGTEVALPPHLKALDHWREKGIKSTQRCEAFLTR